MSRGRLLGTSRIRVSCHDKRRGRNRRSARLCALKGHSQGNALGPDAPTISGTLKACGGAWVPAARFQRANRASCPRPRAALAARACPGLSCPAPSGRKSGPPVNARSDALRPVRCNLAINQLRLETVPPSPGRSAHPSAAGHGLARFRDAERPDVRSHAERRNETGECVFLAFLRLRRTAGGFAALSPSTGRAAWKPTGSRTPGR